MIDTIIRLATEEDIHALLALYAAFHTFHVRGVPDRLREPETATGTQVRALLATLLANPAAALYIAERAGHVVGLAEVELKRDEEHPATVSYTYGYLQSLMVADGQRRSGVGARLVTAAQEWARVHGATELRLSVWEFPAGPLAFYEALGYTTLQRILVKRLD